MVSFVWNRGCNLNPGNLCRQQCWALICQLNCFLQEIWVLLCTKVERVVQYIPLIWLLSTNRMTAADYFKFLSDGDQKHKFLNRSLVVWLGGFGGLTTKSIVGGQINTTKPCSAGGWPLGQLTMACNQIQGERSSSTECCWVLHYPYLALVSSVAQSQTHITHKTTNALINSSVILICWALKHNIWSDDTFATPQNT